MKATINIHNLNLFFNAALNVDELLDSVVKRIQNIDLPSPADLTPVLRQAQEPAPAGEPVEPTPIAPTEPAVTAGVTIAQAASTVIAQLDPGGNLEFLQKQAPSLRSLPPSMVAPAEKEAIFYMRFPPGDPLDPARQVHRNGLRQAQAPTVGETSTASSVEPPVEPTPTPTPAPVSRAQRAPAATKPPPTANHRLATELATKRRANGAGMDFEEFDALVKKEVKRLGTAGIMPSHAHWNEFKDPALPTLTTVITRYGAASAEDLATMLGYSPPLRGPGKNAQTEVQAEPA